MKKIIFTLVVSLFAFAAFAQDMPIQPNQLPANAQSFISSTFAGATIDYCLAYAIFGFRMFVRGCIDKKAEKIDAQNQTADLEPQQQDKPKQKNYRWFDLVVGIYQILVLVATIAIGIILL